jgi:hypothetical protein
MEACQGKTTAFRERRDWEKAIVQSFITQLKIN